MFAARAKHSQTDRSGNENESLLGSRSHPSIFVLVAHVDNRFRRAVYVVDGSRPRSRGEQGRCFSVGST